MNNSIVRAVVSDLNNGTFQVSVLVRIGYNTWKDSRKHKPQSFTDKQRAIAYGATFGEVVS